MNLSNLERKLPRMSIVTPSFNQGQFLEETILSILNQDYPNLEYIIIDGGSTDNSVEIIEKYADSLTYWVSEPDKGQSDAINKGFAKTSGEILAWINSDDVYYPGAFEKIARYFAEHPGVDFIFGHNDDIDEQGEILRRGTYLPFVPHAFRRGFAQICQPTAFWRKRVWERCGPLDTHIHYSMDYDFFYRVLNAGFLIKSIPLKVCAFRYHKDSKFSKGMLELQHMTKHLRKKHFPYLRDTIGDQLDVLLFRGLRRIKKTLDVS